MKRILLVCLVISVTSGYALEPAQVKTDDDFNVSEVVARLDEHMTNVQTWYATAKRCAKKAQPGTKSHTFDMTLLRSVVEVTHPVMVACFDDMEKEQSLEPFFVVWNQFKHEYKQSPEDQLFCREAAFLDMHLYSTMLGQLQRSTTRVSISQMLELYHIIAALPIYELLALLDNIAREIIGLLDQTYQGEDSFFSWLWHNWWVPPTVVSHAVSSLVEGIVTIMTTEKPENAGDDKDEGKKTALVRAVRH